MFSPCADHVEFRALGCPVVKICFFALAVLALDSGLSLPQLISLVFNQSSPRLMIFFFLLPFLTSPLSVIFLSISPLLSLSTRHPFAPSHTFVLSHDTCLFFRGSARHLNANVMSVFWKRCEQRTWPTLTQGMIGRGHTQVSVALSAEKRESRVSLSR